MSEIVIFLFILKLVQPTIFQENLASSESLTEESTEKKEKLKKRSKLTQDTDLASPESLTENSVEKKVKRKKRGKLTQDSDDQGNIFGDKLGR